MRVPFIYFQLYYHGESINVNVHIANNSNRTVKKVKVSGKFFVFFLLGEGGEQTKNL